MHKNRRRAILVFSLPTLLFYVYFFIDPLAKTFYYSFFDWNAITEKKFVFLENYAKLFQDRVFYIALGNTAYLSALSLFVMIPLSFVLAYILYTQIKGFKFFRTVFFIPVVVSTVSVSLIFSFIYEPNFGMLNTLLRAIGLDALAFTWLSDKATAMTAVSVPFLWQNVGLMMMILLAGMQTMSEEILEAAEIDGVNRWQKIWYVVIPLIRNVIQVVIVFAITYAFKVFDHILLLTQGGPIHRTEVTGTYMYNEGFRFLKYGYGTTIAVSIMLVALAAAFLANRLIGRDSDDDAGSIKKLEKI